MPRVHRFAERFARFDSKPEEMIPQDERLRVIFAPSPKTGWPEGDLAIYASNKSTPEIRQFIETALMQYNQPSERGTIEEIEATMPQRGETEEQYYSRIKNFAAQLLSQESKQEEPKEE